MAKIRLDKLLADEGLGTRSQVKEWIKKGKVQVDGVVCKNPQEKVDTDVREVLVDGTKITHEDMVYFVLHKPAGCVTATTDAKDKTVMDYLPKERNRKLAPVGRLDKDTEGLLLITNDGQLAHDLLSPKKHVDKTYYAKVKGNVTKEDVVLFEQGLDIGDEKLTMPAKLKIIEAGDVSQVEVTICEGRFHQVKRMFQAVEKEVIYLKRLSMGKLILDKSLKPGEYMKIKKEDIVD